jgi:hypothetical protein
MNEVKLTKCIVMPLFLVMSYSMADQLQDRSAIYGTEKFTMFRFWLNCRNRLGESIAACYI